MKCIKILKTVILLIQLKHTPIGYVIFQISLPITLATQDAIEKVHALSCSYPRASASYRVRYFCIKSI